MTTRSSLFCEVNKGGPDALIDTPLKSAFAHVVQTIRLSVR